MCEQPSATSVMGLGATVENCAYLNNITSQSSFEAHFWFSDVVGQHVVLTRSK